MLTTLVVMTLITGILLGIFGTFFVCVHMDKREAAKKTKEIQAPGLIDYTKHRTSAQHN